jgi:exonuclease SbcC
MKIKKLVVKGFMRFKEQQELTFPENQVTLIFGENGAGKTSLLDAICIGLYGRTFRTSFDPEAGFLTIADLINHDSTKSSIHIEFENYGHNFVVKREITRNGSHGELLEDGEAKAQNDAVFEYVTMKALGLDWEGFTKSTVILQGEMNALTDALPATRKEMFVKLFGLDKYSRAEQITKVETEEKSLHVKEMEAANEVLTNEVAKIQQVESAIKRLSKTIEKLERQKDGSEKKVKRLAKLRKNLETDYKTYIKLNEKIDSITAQKTNTEKILDGKKNDLQELASLQSDFTSIKKSYREFLSLTKSLKSMKPLKSRYDKLESMMASLRNTLKDRREKFVDIQKDMEVSKTIMNKLKKQIPSQKEIKAVREEMAALERKKVELEENRYQLAALLNVAVNTANELRTNMNKIKRMHVCPVCAQKIQDTKSVLKRYTQQIKSLDTDITKKQNRLKSISMELRKIDQKLTQTPKSKLESIYNRQSELFDESKRFDASTKKRDKISKEIVEVGKEIEKCNKQIRSLRFNVREYDALEKKLGSLRQGKVAEKFSSAQTQLKQIPKLEGEISKMNSSLAKMEKERKRLLAQIKKLRDIENRFAAVKEELQSAENVHEQNVITITKEQTNYKTLVKQLTELKSKKKKLQSNEDEIERLRADMSAFEELMLIFRDIPENILKRLIPYVEKEGTAIINELSEGTITAIKIDSETLNIGAAMAGAVRPIQYFSGGQQTRINMALRIAISRILSRMPHAESQASATMQTLFIDEGDFGNLDEAGVRDAMSVIQNLSREFSRIVLLSHLESVRSNFQGYTAEVVKTTPSQSVISTPVEAISVQREAV